MNKTPRDITKDNCVEIATDLLASDKQILINSFGVSMFPLMRNGDKAIINKVPSNRITKGDLVVGFINQQIVGHRVISIKRINNHFIFTTQGDNCQKADTPFYEDVLIGKVTGFVRNNNSRLLDAFYYRFFSFLIINFGFVVRPFIRINFTVFRFFVKVKHILHSTSSNLQLILKDSKNLVVKNGILAVFQGILPFAIIFLLKRLVDFINKIQTMHNSQQLLHLELLILVTGIVFLLNLIVNSSGSYLREKLSQSISLSVYKLLHSKHSQLDFANLEDSEQQDKIHRATVEAGYRPNKLVGASLSLLRSIVAGIIVIGLMLSIHWIIVVILTIGLLPGLLIHFRFSRKMYELNKKHSTKERQAYYYNRILTGIPFAKELRLFATSDLFSSLFLSLQVTMYKGKNNVNRKQLFAEIISQSVAIVLIFLAFGFVAQLAVKGTVTVGTLVLFFLVFQRGFVILKELFQAVASLYEDNIFFEDFVAFLKMSSTPNNEISKNRFPKINKGITLENVSFQYPSSSRLALQAISMTIPAGKTVALVGVNGSGKSTLVKLLCGFYVPTQGSISFDDIKMDSSNQAQIRNGITAVFQDFALYNMTVAENIWLGNNVQSINYDRIEQSGKMAGIHESIQTLPLGYENMIGNFFEKGEELSIGQWQKLAIARAFYRDSDILLMDEPSSALDADTEKQVIESLKTLAKDKTVLIISHRFSTIQWADLIYVMDEGSIVESGNHQELMQKKGKYFETYSL
jgi:ATP-binding cassette, subfamily B, bacterial